MSPVDFATDPAMAGLFATFAAGVTQIVKEQFQLTNKLHIRVLSVAAFAAAVFLHYSLPDVWRLVFDIVAGGTGVTGGVGLLKEIRDNKKSDDRVSE